jgi:predicted kinase
LRLSLSGDVIRVSGLNFLREETRRMPVNSGIEQRLHLVFGPPAAGKSVYAKALAKRIGGCLLDSDEVTERMVRAGLALAGLDPDDRHSPSYRAAFRDPVYETLFDLAVSNLPNVPVVIAGPFTREGDDPNWPHQLALRLGVMPEFHFVWCPPEVRRQRIIARGEGRDLPKLADWENYVSYCREEPPVFPHQWIVTG